MNDLSSQSIVMEGTRSPLILKLRHGAELSDADRAMLEDAAGDTFRVGPRQDLIQEGERPEHVRLVLEGFACRYKLLPNGRRQIVALLVPGDFCDLRVSILGVMDHTIATLSACKIAHLPHSKVEELLDSSRAINRALWWATLVDEAVLREWLVSMGRRSAKRQIAHLFCELLVRLGAVGLAACDGYELPLSQNDLADVLGLTPVHVNRMLQQMRADGLVMLEGRRLSILDLPRLHAFAGFNPNYLHLERDRQAL